MTGFVLPLAKAAKHYLHPFYLQTVSTILLLPLSCTETFLVVSTISAFRRLRDKEIYQKDKKMPSKLMARQNAVEESDDDDDDVS